MGNDACATNLAAEGNDIYGLMLERIDGRPLRLARYWKQVLLVVNVASCSPLSAQLHELQVLHDRYSEAGLRILAFPCSDFGGMGPQDNDQLQKHYEQDLGLSFPLFSKVSIASPPCHPLFAMLAAADGALSGPCDTLPHGLAATAAQAMTTCKALQGDFEKFLVSRDGRLLRRFASEVPPLAPAVLAVLEPALQIPRDGRRLLAPIYGGPPATAFQPHCLS